MRAAVWHGRRDVRIEEVPEPPVPPPGQVQVEVAWCGICGTDLHEYLGGPLYIPERAPHPLTGVQAPVIIGHEMSGRIAAVGDGIQDLAVGDRIAACPIVGCGECRWCRSGSMAQCEKVAFLGSSWTGGALSERLNLNAYQCYKLPDSISDEVGALVEPFSATYRALVQGKVGPDDNVAILGAGPIGLMNLMAARILGAKRVVVLEVSERRIETALRCGAAAVINPSLEDPHMRALECTDGAGFDVVVECAGRESTGLLAGRLVRTRGRVIVMGVFEKPAPLDFTDLVFREKTIIGSMSGYGLYNESIAVMNDGRFYGEILITNRIPLAALIEEGFQPLLGQDRQVKILVSPRSG
ncbi:MAG: 2,3-butanediol dehydrogenase [Bryobacteraceae bacterium]|jgi:(R,R)-butanediol dehydrogenase/meso-butanediol dehydrogenase/diacetyl reductase